MQAITAVVVSVVVAKPLPLNQADFAGGEDSRLESLTIGINNEFWQFIWSQLVIGQGLCITMLPNGNSVRLQMWRTQDLLESVIQEMCENG